MSDPSIINDPQSEQNPPVDFARPWILHYEQGVPTQLKVPDHPLTWLLDQPVSRYPGHTAFIYYGTKLSYAQFSSLPNPFATSLQPLLITKRTRIPIALPNIP